MHDMLASSLLGFLPVFNPSQAYMFRFFHSRVVDINHSGLFLCCKHLSTILVITFEPFELFRSVTTHLKAKNPL